MMRVKNRRVTGKISRAAVRLNGRRNLAAIIAIVLTATLFTTLFTVGGGLLSAYQEATMRQVGTRAHAGFKFLTQEQYDLIASDPQIVDISYNIIAGFAKNPELSKIYTEVRYTEEKSADWGFCLPTTGTLPVEKYDIATTTNVLDALNVRHELGETVTLELMSNGRLYTQEFSLCGFWDDEIAMGANEIFVSREYCDEVAPVITVPFYETEGDVTCFDGSINPSLWFRSPWNIDKQIYDLKQRLDLDSRVNDGVNWAYSTAMVDGFTILLLVVVLLLIGASCYLIIYNVFEITVTKDIRFYGLLKTVGTTGRQLRAIVRKQAFLLSMVGVPIGLLIGFVIGKIIMPIIIMPTVLSEIDFNVKTSPLIFVLGAVFAMVTVIISCERPCRIASKVFPVEAVRWNEGNATILLDKKRKVKNGSAKRTRPVTPFVMAVSGMRRDKRKMKVVILSLTLSLVLLNGTYTLINGFDIEIFLKNTIVTDFALADASIRTGWSDANIVDGVSNEVLEDISRVSGVTEVGAVYCDMLVHTFSNTAYENARGIIERNRDKLPSPYADYVIGQFEEKHGINTFVYGVDEELWDKLDLIAGDFDKEKFATGDYVLATGFWSDSGKDVWYEIGDDITIDFDNGNIKTYEVMATGDIPYALSQQFSFPLDMRIVLPTDEYIRQTGSVDAMSVGFDVDDEHNADVEGWIKDYTENVRTNLAYESRATKEEDFKNDILMFKVVGGVLTAILALIGILNFANAVITSVDSRRREFAILQSVGMEKRQLVSQLIWEGLIYAVGTLFLALTLGNALMYGLVALVSRDMWFFVWHFSILPLIICAPVLIFVCFVVPFLCCRSMCRMTIVERLREG